MHARGVFVIMFIIAGLLAGLVAAVAAREESFHEELLFVPLASNDIMSHFRFTTLVSTREASFLTVRTLSVGWGATEVTGKQTDSKNNECHQVVLLRPRL